MFESSVLFYTLKIISITRNSDLKNVSNQVFHFNFTNATVFKTNGRFKLSTIANGDFRFDKKQNELFDIEAVILILPHSNGSPRAFHLRKTIAVNRQALLS